MNHNSIDWQEVIKEISELATSELASQNLIEMQPCASKQQANQSFEKIENFQQLLLLGNRPFMESLDVYYTWISRLKKNATLKTLELKDIRHFAAEAYSLKEYLEKLQLQWTSHYAESIFNADEVISAINQLITDDGNIRNDASEKLFNLFKEKEQLTSKVEKSLEKLVKQNELEGIIQDKFVTDREGRLVIPVRSGMQHNLEGIVHAASQSRQTVYMEPQLVIPMNNRLKEVEQEIIDEVESLLAEISDYIFSLLQNIETTKDTMLECDIIFAKAKFSLITSSTKPTFTDNQILLKNIKHPLLILKGEDVISNSVELNEDKRVLILTGPNAGGKTVLLKSIGLAAEMARHGLLTCCDENSEVPFFNNLFIAVGDLQSVDENLSTFAGHLKVLNEGLKAKGNDQLLLIDEICGSTDPEEGAALARSFISEYCKNQCFAVITSHLSPLKTGWPKDAKVINGSLEYDAKTGRPTYQFIMGIPGESLALQTAIRVGVDKKIIDQALNFMSPETKQQQKKLAEAEEIKTQLLNTKLELEKALKQATREKSHYHALVEKFNKEKDQILQNELTIANKRIDDLIGKAKVEHVFKKHENLQKMQAELPKVLKSQSQKKSSIQSADEFQKAFPPGSKIFVESLGKDAIVQSKPNSKGEVSVLAGSMMISIQWEQLKPPMKSQNPTGKILKSKGVTHSPLDIDRVIDLRGMKSEEALNLLESDLDTASVNHEDRVKVIHGHGTESLKRTVRQYLSRSVYVKKWYAAQSHQGGDGVTWVEL